MGKTINSKQLSLFLVVSLAICGVVLFTACSQGSQPAQTNQSPRAMQTVKMDVSWTRLYHHLSDLKRASDLTVTGTVTGIDKVIKDKKGIVSTLFVFSIRRVVWNPRHLVQLSSIIINQTGGVIGNVRYEVGDDPLFQQGEQAVLFLHQYSPGYYFVVGGPSGRFTIQSGMVKPINDEGVIFSTPLSETDFLKKIQNA